MPTTLKTRTGKPVAKRKSVPMPLRARGVTVDGKPISAKQWDGLRQPLGQIHAKLFESLRYLNSNANDVFGALISRKETELRTLIRQCMEMRDGKVDSDRVDDCIAEIEAVGRFYGYERLGVRIGNYSFGDDAA